LAGFDLAVVDQPAADRHVGLVVVAGECHANQLRAPVGADEPQAARALNLQQQRVERVGHVGDLAAMQCGLRSGQGVDLRPREPGLVRGRVGWRCIQGHAHGAARHAAGIDLRLEVAARPSPVAAPSSGSTR
jgi:hypothetical protein